MWSHAITDGSGGTGETVQVQNASCPACDRSDATFDVRHSLTMNSVYQLPIGPGRNHWNAKGVAGDLLGGWQVSGILTARSGLPVNITVTRKAADMLDGNNKNQRPDLIPGVPIYAAEKTIYNWFNPAAFAVPAKGTWGNLKRNVARGPGFWEIDTALSRVFPIRERLSFELRGEAFNLTNSFRSCIGCVGGLLGGTSVTVRNSPQFGQITVAGSRLFAF